jgi:hypothetical protein
MFYMIYKNNTESLCINIAKYSNRAKIRKPVITYNYANIYINWHIKLKKIYRENITAA